MRLSDPDDIPENKAVPGLVPRPVVCIVRPGPMAQAIIDNPDKKP